MGYVASTEVVTSWQQTTQQPNPDNNAHFSMCNTIGKCVLYYKIAHPDATPVQHGNCYYFDACTAAGNIFPCFNFSGAMEAL
jgi:hypothetical protein